MLFNKSYATNRDNDSVKYYNLKAQLLFEQHKFDSAYYFYDKLTSFDPSNYEAYKSKADILLNMNQLDKAKVEIDKALKLKQDYYDGYAVLGAIYRKQNNLVEARKVMNLMIAINPELPLPYYYLAVMDYIQKDYTKALKNFDLSVLKGGDYAKTYYYRGQVNEILGNYTVAINDYLACYKLSDTYVICLTYAGHCYEMLKDTNKAEEYYNKAVVIEPKNKDCLRYRANFFYSVQRFSEAKIDLCNLLLIGESQNYEVYHKLSIIELVFNNFDKSLEYCNQSISIFELKDNAHFNAELRCQRLVIYMLLSKYDLIISETDIIKKHNVNIDASIHSLIAISYFCLDKTESFRNVINTYSNENAVSNRQLMELKLFSLLVDDKYDSWVDLCYYHCLLNQMKYESFDLYKPVNTSDSSEIKEVIRKEYTLSKSIDSDYSVGFSLGFTEGNKKTAATCENLIKAINVKLLGDIQNKEVLYLIRGQLYQQLGKNEEALKDFNRAVEMHNKLAAAYYLRAEHKKNILNDFLGASDDYSKAQMLSK